jgi:hypothetical protein
MNGADEQGDDGSDAGGGGGAGFRIEYGCKSAANGRAFGAVTLCLGDHVLHGGRGDLYSESFRKRFARDAAAALGLPGAEAQIERLLLVELSHLQAEAAAATSDQVATVTPRRRAAAACRSSGSTPARCAT